MVWLLCGFQEKNPLYQAAKTTFENPTYAGGRPCWADQRIMDAILWTWITAQMGRDYRTGILA